MDISVVFGRIFSLILVTLVLAVCYGIFITSVDLGGPGYSPANSGQRAAGGIYRILGATPTIDPDGIPDEPSGFQIVAHKVAKPYALLADVSASVGGEIELGIQSMLRGKKK